LGRQKLDQVARLAGKEAEQGVPYNPDEPMPPRFEVKPPTVEVMPLPVPPR